MANSLAKQIGAAVIARCASISGIGETGVDPKEPSQVNTFPAVYLLADEENKTNRTMADTGGEKTCVLRLVVGAYVKDVAPLSALYDLVEAVEEAVEAPPYHLGVDGVMHAFITDVQRFRAAPPLSQEIGIGYVTVTVKYNQLHGSA